MTRLIPAAAMAVLALAATNVSAQLVYEPFEYGSAAVGQPFANQTGTPAFSGYVVPSSGQTWFTSATSPTVSGTINSGDDKIIAAGAGSLTTPDGLAPSAGDIGGSTVADEHVANMAMTPTSFGGAGTTVYNSVLFTVNDLTSGVTNATGAFIYGMATSSYAGNQGSTPTVLGASLQVRHDTTDPTKFNVGLRPNNGTIQWDTADKFAPGTPVFLVFGYTFTASTATDLQQMWVNPSPSTFGAASAPAVATETWTGNGVSTPLKTLFINRGAANTASPTAMQFDEIRVDNTWAQVTPATGSTFTAASSTDWNNPGTWNAGGVPNSAASFAYLTGSAGGAVNVNSPQTVGTLTFKGPGSYTVSSTNASGLTLDAGGGAGGTSAINVQAPMDPAGPDLPVVTAHTIAVPVALANKLAVNVALGQTLTMSGNISDATGSATVAKNGPGTLVLSGTNSYGGPTTVTSGTLSINGDAALGIVPATPTLNIILTKGTGTTSILRFDADATLNPNRTIELLQNGGGGPSINTNGHNVTIAGQITAGAGGANLNKFGAGTLTLTGDNSQTLLVGGGALNSLQINEGTVNATRDEAIGKLGTNINIGGGGTFQFGAQFNPTGRPVATSTGGGFIDTNGFNVTIDGVVSGSANLTKNGAGTLTLTGANTLNAATRLTGGTLVLTQPAYNGVLTATGGNGVVNAGTLVLDYTGNGTPASTVVPLLKSSHDSSNFTDVTQRLRTSNTNDANKGLGYYDDGVSKFSVIYTWYGDANLDGTVNGDDYALLDRAVAQGASPSWVSGDFNYDGLVNSADYLAIDTSYGKITGVLAPSLLAAREAEFGAGYVAALTAAVPEPSAVAACCLAAAGFLRRRRQANAI